MKFKVRKLAPEQEQNFSEIEAEIPGEAANEYHYSRASTFSSLDNTVALKRDEESSEVIKYSLVEVEGHGEFVCRSFHKGIRRGGEFNRGSISINERLARVAKVLKWDRPLEELIAPWEGEEEEWERG